MPVALRASADDSAHRDIEGGEQTRAVATGRLGGTSVLARKPDVDCETLQRTWEAMWIMVN